MATINCFEDIIAWQKARENDKDIFFITSKSKEFSRDFSLVDQIRRASGSIMDNIAEGFERGGKRSLFNSYILLKGLLLKLDLNYTGLLTEVILMKRILKKYIIRRMKLVSFCLDCQNILKNQKLKVRNLEFNTVSYNLKLQTFNLKLKAWE